MKIYEFRVSVAVSSDCETSEGCTVEDLCGDVLIAKSMEWLKDHMVDEVMEGDVAVDAVLVHETDLFSDGGEQ